MDIYNGTYIDTIGRKEKWPEEFLIKNNETTEAQRKIFTKAHRAGVPIIFGVLTTEDEKQAWDRLGGNHGHKGIEAAEAALAMHSVLQQI